MALMAPVARFDRVRGAHGGLACDVPLAWLTRSFAVAFAAVEAVGRLVRLRTQSFLAIFPSLASAGA